MFLLFSGKYGPEKEKDIVDFVSKAFGVDSIDFQVS